MIKRIGLIANPEKLKCRTIVRRAVSLIQREGRLVLTEVPTAQLAGLGVSRFRSAVELARAADLLLVFGGDGTMLRVSREVAGTDTPILGINAGGLGFLTAVPSKQMDAALQALWRGNYEIETRPLIEASARIQGGQLAQRALNDFVISRGTVSRMIELEVMVNGAVLTRYRCDGLIVSSPTGSTAYSLAAGGAVVSPDSKVFALTPICPHTLSNRSVIVDLDSVVQVRVLSRKLEVVLTADGQVQTALEHGDVVTICRSRQSLRLVRLAGSSFFATLRQKLNWSGSHVRG